VSARLEIDPPREIGEPLMVIELLESALFGMLVRVFALPDIDTPDMVLTHAVDVPLVPSIRLALLV